MPDGQGFSLKDDALLRPVVHAALDAGLPVLTHSSEPVGHVYPGKGTVTPETISHFAAAFPDLTLICAHWGGGLFAYELMPEVAVTLRNVYYDTAATPYLYQPRVYDIAIAAVGAEKILFGSDFPLLRQRRCLDHLTANTADSAAVERILFANARRILRLED
jgi:predicted TIM-barrel fold metal-dependent hydrolase